MKLVTALCLIVSMPVLASTGKEIKAKFAASEVLKNTLAQLEREHHTSCTGNGRISTFMPKLTKSVAYNASCGSVKFKIEAKFKDVKEPVFTLDTIKVWDKNFIVLNDGDMGEEFELEEDVLSSDPFIEAYKKSQLVRDVRHFTEDSQKVVCDNGRARKGFIGGKANYFYFVTCKSDATTVKVKIKAKVRVIGDNFFAFDLTKYKLSFK